MRYSCVKLYSTCAMYICGITAQWDLSITNLYHLKTKIKVPKCPQWRGSTVVQNNICLYARTWRRPNFHGNKISENSTKSLSKVLRAEVTDISQPSACGSTDTWPFFKPVAIANTFSLLHTVDIRSPHCLDSLKNYSSTKNGYSTCVHVCTRVSTVETCQDILYGIHKINSCQQIFYWKLFTTFTALQYANNPKEAQELVLLGNSLCWYHAFPVHTYIYTILTTACQVP